MIYDAILYGKLSGCFTIMDATSRHNLPAGVSDTRLPSWILPNVDDSTRKLFRPDLLIIEGLMTDFVSAVNIHDPVVLGNIQRTCTIHIVEVGYTSDSSYTTSLNRKHFQHLALRRCLIDAGWRVHHSRDFPYHILLFSFTGYIFSPCREVLSILGIDSLSSIKLRRKLVVHAVHFVFSIVQLRRHLEWSFDSDIDPP